MGGRDAGEEWINSHANLLTLHRRCHDWIENNPEHSRRHGWILPAGAHPEQTPVYNTGDSVWYRLHGADFRTPTSAGPAPMF